MMNGYLCDSVECFGYGGIGNRSVPWTLGASAAGRTTVVCIVAAAA
jgi:hypothetical protein